jgi:RHS repeat-associated protein
MTKMTTTNNIKNKIFYIHTFGMALPGRANNAGSYRYGFNGKEKETEITNTESHLDFGARIYDSRLGRWLSLDPLQVKYPSLSPYNFTANNPILFIDPDGKAITIHKTSTYDGPAPTRFRDLGATSPTFDLSFNRDTKEWDLIVNINVRYTSALRVAGANGMTLEAENPGVTQFVEAHEGTHVSRTTQAANTSVSYTTNLINGENQTFNGTADKVMTDIVNAYDQKRTNFLSDQKTMLENKYNPLIAAADRDVAKISELQAQAQNEFNTIQQEFDNIAINDINSIKNGIIDKVKAKSAAMNRDGGVNGVMAETSKNLPAGSNAKRIQDGAPVTNQGTVLK